MSSSIAIPKRKTPRHGASNSISYSSSPSVSGSPRISEPSSLSSTPSKGWPERRQSLLGSSLSRSEHTVINVGHPDGPPRLVTCLKSSQGFEWNQDIFLPSYASRESSELERKQDPVTDIILSDEEAAAILPK